MKKRALSTGDFDTRHKTIFVLDYVYLDMDKVLMLKLLSIYSSSSISSIALVSGFQMPTSSCDSTS